MHQERSSENRCVIFTLDMIAMFDEATVSCIRHSGQRQVEPGVMIMNGAQNKVCGDPEFGTND